MALEVDAVIVLRAYVVVANVAAKTAQKALRTANLPREALGIALLRDCVSRGTILAITRWLAPARLIKKRGSLISHLRTLALLRSVTPFRPLCRSSGGGQSGPGRERRIDAAANRPCSSSPYWTSWWPTRWTSVGCFEPGGGVLAWSQVESANHRGVGCCSPKLGQAEQLFGRGEQ